MCLSDYEIYVQLMYCLLPKLSSSTYNKDTYVQNTMK